MMNVQRAHRRQRGMTLVELLIVVTIVTILLSLAASMVRPAFRDRNLREAARQVNTFFAGARARAQATGRPFGVWIERIDTTELGSRAAAQLFMAEVAPPFSGALAGARVTVQPSPGNLPQSPPGRLHFWTASGSYSTIDAALLADLLDVDEQFTIQFDYKGPIYIGARAPDVATTAEYPSPHVFLITSFTGPPPGTAHPQPPVVTVPIGTGLPFQILRGPRRTSAQPLTLPGDAVIDLAVSGVGTSGFEFNPLPAATGIPVIITFTPTGTIDYVYVNFDAYRPFGPVHLLIGRRAQVVNPDPAITNFANPAVPTNLTDPANFWVSIGHRTGRIVTSNNVENRGLPAAATVPERIREARDLARSSVQIGGR